MPEICYGDMQYIRLKTTDPYLNLAIEEHLFKNSEEDIFMLWQNRPSVIIGKNQNAYAEVELAYAEERGIDICRRITGGGAVYHDEGNLNYTFITNTGGEHTLDYAYFARPIISALSSFGITATLSGRNDLECGGKKISGNAQAVSGGRILHHGTLLFGVDVDTLQSVLRTDKEKLAFRAVKSHRGRVGNLSAMLGEDVGIDGFIEQIEKQILAKTGAVPIPPPTGEAIDALTKRNRSREWIFSDKRYLTDYTVSRRQKYPFGIVCVEMKLSGDIIEDVTVSGDFFGKRPIEELEALLIGHRADALPSLPIADYINDMRAEEFNELIR